jgi:hypothetical protein
MIKVLYSGPKDVLSTGNGSCIVESGGSLVAHRTR